MADWERISAANEIYNGVDQIWPDNLDEYSTKHPEYSDLPINVLHGFSTLEESQQRAEILKLQAIETISQTLDSGFIPALILPLNGSVVPLINVLDAAKNQKLIKYVKYVPMVRNLEGSFELTSGDMQALNLDKVRGIIVDNIFDTGKTSRLAKALAKEHGLDEEVIAEIYGSTRECNKFVPMRGTPVFPKDPWITSGLGLDSGKFKMELIGAAERMSFLATIGDRSDWHPALIANGMKDQYFRLLDESCMFNKRTIIKQAVIDMELARTSREKIKVLWGLVSSVKDTSTTTFPNPPKPAPVLRTLT